MLCPFFSPNLIRQHSPNLSQPKNPIIFFSLLYFVCGSLTLSSLSLLSADPYPCSYSEIRRHFPSFLLEFELLATRRPWCGLGGAPKLLGFVRIQIGFGSTIAAKIFYVAVVVVSGEIWKLASVKNGGIER
ncbi:hypothetical protein FCV25MIE_20166 [Fagus crenata]